MEVKEEGKTESGSPSTSTANKTNGSSHDSSGHADEAHEDFHSSKKESGSLWSSLVNTVFLIQNSLFKKRPLLEIWHQFLLNKILYNKNYTNIDATFCFIERKTRVRREEIFYGAIFLLVVFILLQNFDPLLCTTVSCLYPAYQTTRSLTIHKTKACKRREHWLIYWIVFSFFTLQDYYTEWLTKFYSPFLSLKMLFLMLLALPQTGMTKLCYRNIVVPTLSIINDAFMKYNRRINGVANVTRNGSEGEEKTS